jgi:hypothetical protein
VNVAALLLGVRRLPVPAEVIPVAVRWYLRYSLSYCDAEELLAERGITVDQVTIYRWVQRLTPEFIEAARFGRPHTRATWYEPLEQQDDIDLAVWWAMSRPGVFLDSVGDVDLLPKVLDAASRFTGGPDDAAMSALTERTAADPLFV